MGTLKSAKRISLAALSLLLAASTVACSSSGVPWVSPGTSTAPVVESPSTVPTEAATEAPTPEPTPEPTPLPPFLTPDMVAGVCAGTAAPDAAPLTGKLHPIVVADASDSSDVRLASDYTENTEYMADPVAYNAQLVACISAVKWIKVSYCGQYKRFSDGKIGDVFRYKQSRTVRVMNAQTGKQWQAKTFVGKPASCKDQVRITMDPPPWGIFGGPITASTIEAYLKSVSTIAVK